MSRPRTFCNPVPVDENGKQTGIITPDNVDKMPMGNLTQKTKSLLESNAGLPWQHNIVKVEDTTDSIYEVASKANMTLMGFVEHDPEFAIHVAETSYGTWNNILTQVALTGHIETEKGTVRVNMTQMNALTQRVEKAKEDLDHVFDLAMSIAFKGEKKSEHLIRLLYNSAFIRHDNKAMTYLIDRVEGRPAETAVIEQSYDNAHNIYMIIHTLFDKQLQVLNAGNGTILVCCSRRAGKTHLLVAASLLECLRKPNTICVYIGETMELTMGLIETAMNEIIDSCHLTDRKGKRFNWKHMDNGSQILVRGLSNTKDPDQIRGNKAKVIVIDEFFHLKSELLEYLQREVLQPMQLDYADDYKFLCAGTPPQIKGTFGEYAWKTWNCPHFTWTWRENPHPVALEEREAYIQNMLDEKGLTWDVPFVRREYLGEWAYDDDLLLYPEVHTFDIDKGIPSWPISRIFFGIDYGVSDNDSIIGIAWSDEEHKGYQFYEEKFNRLDIQHIAISQLDYLKKKVIEAWGMALDFFPGLSPKEANKRIYWDADDNDQHCTNELNVNLVLPRVDPVTMEETKLRINVCNAHKTDKTLAWDKINELFKTGALLLIANSKVAHECVSTILKRGPNGEIYNDIDNNAYHPDLLPAMRYALWNVLGV